MYITDLDNTLLRSNGEISDYSLKQLRHLIKSVDVTVATARSLFTSGVVLDYIDFKLPIIISNGAAIYDPVNKKYLYTAEIKDDLYFDIVSKSKINPFVVGIHNGKEILLHKAPENEVQRKHLNSRLKYNDKRQTLVEEYPLIDKVLNLVFIDTADKIMELENVLSEYDGLTVYKYPKARDELDYYCLDVTSKLATKGNAIMELSRILGKTLSKITGFGDDVNDVSMFNVVGTPVLVSNSKLDLDYLRIGSNDTDAVVKYIENNETKYTRVNELNFNLDELVDDSRKEDYNFVRRLRDEFIAGYNKFDQPGECLFLAHIGNRVIGSCGMNMDPYITDKNYGRVRHLYVLEEYRNRGIASKLLELVMNEGKKTFDTLTLRTFNDSASNLYIKHGFKKNDSIPYATHHMEVRRKK